MARNEYYLRTSGFRRYRKLFPYVAFLSLAIYILFLSPAMFSATSELTKEFILSEQALSFMQVILFVIFISVLTIPVMQTLQDTNVTPLETLLSTPIEAKDVLIGKYLGSLPNKPQNYNTY